MRSIPALTGRTSHRVLAGLVVALIALCGCAPKPPTRVDVVLELFELAHIDEPVAERVDGLFGSVEDEQARAALLDAIQALRPVDEVEIVQTYAMDDLLRVSFDLIGQLPGGGLAHYSVQLDTATEPGTIVWFSGPGVEWPDRKPRGPGLSTSAPPAAGGGRIR